MYDPVLGCNFPPYRTLPYGLGHVHPTLHHSSQFFWYQSNHHHVFSRDKIATPYMMLFQSHLTLTVACSVSAEGFGVALFVSKMVFDLWAFWVDRWLDVHFCGYGSVWHFVVHWRQHDLQQAVPTRRPGMAAGYIAPLYPSTTEEEADGQMLLSWGPRILVSRVQSSSHFIVRCHYFEDKSLN